MPTPNTLMALTPTHLSCDSATTARHFKHLQTPTSTSAWVEISLANPKPQSTTLSASPPVFYVTHKPRGPGAHRSASLLWGPYLWLATCHFEMVLLEGAWEAGVRKGPPSSWNRGPNTTKSTTPCIPKNTYNTHNPRPKSTPNQLPSLTCIATTTATNALRTTGTHTHSGVPNTNQDFVLGPS